MSSAPIVCIGLMWEVRNVYWDASSTCLLLGVPVRRRRSSPVDFSSQNGVYVLYENFFPIYVGQSNGTLFDRLKVHYYHDDLAGRWNRFSWFGFRRVKRNGQLSQISDFHITSGRMRDHLEALLIHSFEPPMNGQVGRFGQGVIRYKQVRDSRLGPDDRALAEMVAKNGNFLNPGSKITKQGWK